MPYTHFGKQADIFKHLILCEVLKNEMPETYVETNSAYAEYRLNRTLEQQYGIYYFLDKASGYKQLCESPYLRLEAKAMDRNAYLGSPALAMDILDKSAYRFIFFDIEEEPLNDIRIYAGNKELSAKIETINRESTTGSLELLPSLPPSSFLHIDPYEIDKPGPDGITYLDVFMKAARMGMKCYLWYGFMTLDSKEQLNRYITENIDKNQLHGCVGTELILEIIKDNIPSCNPGILGSGILTANLSQKSNDALLVYSDALVNMYKEATYNGYKGTLYKDILLNN